MNVVAHLSDAESGRRRFLGEREGRRPSPQNDGRVNAPLPTKRSERVTRRVAMCEMVALSPS